MHRSEVAVADQLLWNLGAVLVLVGLALVLIAVIWLVFSGARNGRTKIRGGGAVIIGPIPIVFGTDKESVKAILVLSIVLIVLLLILMMFSKGLFS